jgi:hypothetical protein
LTASVTQTQGGGLALLNQVNQVATCATDGNAVTLPEALAGRPCVVINNGAKQLQVFPAADDSINALAADLSITINAGEAQIFKAIGDIVWKTVLPINSITTVAAATYDVLATDELLHVTYTATGAVTSITLPTAGTTRGRKLTITDSGGNSSVNNITVDTEASETISGAATAIISGDYDSIDLYSDGANWFIH